MDSLLSFPVGSFIPYTCRSIPALSVLPTTRPVTGEVAGFQYYYEITMASHSRLDSPVALALPP